LSELANKKARLYIASGSKMYLCAVKEPITWETERQNVPGKLTFEVVKDDWENFGFHEGDAVRFEYDGQKVFYGVVFTKKRTSNRFITVTALDQLRYFKNKDTYVYTNKTADQVLKMVAADFGINLGNVESTGYVIPSRIEDKQELFSIVNNALSETVHHTGATFVLRDNFGAVDLKSLASLKTDILIDEESGESFEYTSTIEDGVYNKIKLVYEDKKSKKREVFIAQDGGNINQWGVLQLLESIDDTVNAKARADVMLAMYNRKKRSLHMKDVFGNVRAFAGASLAVNMYLGDITVANFMVIEKAKHSFYESRYKMDLALIGGGFSA